jgi:uncharacterized protein with HEPN domain
MSNIPEHDAVRLRHMLDAAHKARLFLQDRSRSDLESDEMLALAVVRLLEILGEAAARVSPTAQAKLPAIPWRQIVGTRNRLIHGYFDVDLDIIWAIVQHDLPACIVVLETVFLPLNSGQSPPPTSSI